MGIPIKVDTHTGNMDRARYARVCIEIDLRKTLPPKVKVGRIVQKINYEIKSLFCFGCGCLGHLATYCSVSGKASEKQPITVWMSF